MKSKARKPVGKDRHHTHFIDDVNYQSHCQKGISINPLARHRSKRRECDAHAHTMTNVPQACKSLEMWVRFCVFPRSPRSHLICLKKGLDKVLVSPAHFRRHSFLRNWRLLSQFRGKLRIGARSYRDAKREVFSIVEAYYKLACRIVCASSWAVINPLPPNCY